ncbi:MAG: hypothetical protein CBC79_00095 [Gammaproteobacteria bacterium TMED119]|nr:MAG: hypothetical protein CBC79_00095 [Gammaproteobacteria bacterium TMED119]RCL46089.1 MAG: HAD-IIB family hydrolase [Candidatus Thioglobus sp.]
MNALSPIVFTDMDGSLLDHYDYSHSCADELLAQLKSCSVPVIPTTSKTRTECLALRAELNNTDPFITENGAAIYIPHNYFKHVPEDVAITDAYYVKTMVADRAHWQNILAQFGARHAETFISFQQAGIDGIMRLTGLDKSQARRAAQREYGEPIKWLGTAQQYDLFCQHMQSNHAQLLKGGRFIHVSGDCDKGRALAWTMAHFQYNFERPLVSIALGDSANDVAMLEAADYAVVIRSPVHDIPQIHAHNELIVTEQYGPEGWVEGLTKILNKLAINIE